KGAVAVFSDITKIKEDQEALQESEERFRSLIDATFEGIIVYDKGIIMDANNSAVRLFGYENPSIMTGRSILELVAEEVVDDIKEKVGRVTKDPDVEIGAFETTAVKENGEKFYVEVYGRGLMQQGKRVRVIAFRDITERKRAEKELKYRLEFENLITTISSRFINLSPDEIDEGIHSALGNIAEFANVDRSYVFLLSQAGSAVDCTHEWCAECVKPTIDQCQKMPADTFPWLYEKLMHDESVYIPSVPDMPPEAASEREQFESENIQSVVIVPMRARGRFKGFLGFDSVKEKKEWSDDIIILLKIVGEIFVNALAHKNFLEELNKANEDLEKKVEERTRELKDKHIMLINSEKMASLGQLVAGVAHEINTPLGALKSNNDVFIRSTVKIKAKLDELRKEEFKEEFVILDKMYNSIDKLNDINKTAAERITNIVSSLRKFARLDEAEKDTVDIHEGIESTLTLVHHEYKNRITLHKEFGNIPYVNCFPNQLNQVFMNILINAGQAIEDKGDVFIKTSIVDKEKVEVIIEDNGKGIRKEDLKNIFNPGFTTKGVGVGTGLGLSIVYQIIKDHNGKIEIDSEVGIGTSVRILLPVK
ncbi:MAG: PAS domain S-box protein, partial [bacterium]|nr:PAS domain S-box protein [bacterium]